MLISSLLSRWCEALHKLQIKETGNPRTDGGIICPSCGMVHGRSADAMYPFMHMAAATGKSEWIESAESLFDWTENTVSLSSGGYRNDIDSGWVGITVFSALQMLDCIEFHGNIMGKAFKTKVENRLRKAADFLLTYSMLEKNTNYPVSDALALYRLGRYFDDERYASASMDYRNVIWNVFTEDNLIYGESSPRDRLSPKGLKSIDIGYNVEETLPAITALAIASGDDDLLDLAIRGFRSHLSFMLSDGGWDNSFGTRNFKWTYWGSRTSDGAALALLQLSGYDSMFAESAYRNLLLLEKCTTSSGLLLGGPGYEEAGQSPCVHHSFSHAKVLAAILDHGYSDEIPDSAGMHYSEDFVYFRDLDTYKVSFEGYTATVTGYDWPYMRGGHVSGGTLSLLHHSVLGPVIAAGPAIYSLKEPNNMQIPYGDIIHESLAPRITHVENGIEYSSVFDGFAKLSGSNRVIRVSGFLRDADGRAMDAGSYGFEYSFAPNHIEISINVQNGVFILPVICSSSDFSVAGNKIIIPKDEGCVIVQVDTGRFDTLYGDKRIFSLVPGFSAVPIRIATENSKAKCKISFSEIKEER